MIELLAIDVAKQSFRVHGVPADGRMISRHVGRSRLVALPERLAPAVVAMEARATAPFYADPHWTRALPDRTCRCISALGELIMPCMIQRPRSCA